MKKNNHSSLPPFSLRAYLFGVGLGFLIISFGALLQMVQSPVFVSAPAYSYAYTEVKKPKPIKIVIPSLYLSLPIFETHLKNNTWEINPNGVSHLVTSAVPNESGSIIMYGHNTNDRLGSLSQISRGKTIEITTDQGQVYSYRVTEILTVWPTNIDTLKADHEQLILYTCAGVADLQRLVVKAERI